MIELFAGQLAAAVALKVAQSPNPSALAAQVLRIPLTCHPKVFPGVLPPRPSVPVYNDHAVETMLGIYPLLS